LGSLLVLEPDAQIIELLQSSAVDASIEAILPDGSNRWAISPQLGRFLANLVSRFTLRNVLEFGAGSSSLVLAQALSISGSGRLTSIEHMPEWCAEKWAAVGRISNVDAHLIVAAPRFTVSRRGFYHIFSAALRELASRGPFDLVLIDAPQYFYGRDGSLHAALPHLAQNALIVLDDAARSGERWTLWRWLRIYSGLRLVVYDSAFGGKGVAVLRYSGDQSAKIDPQSLLTSAYQAARAWKKRRECGKKERVFWPRIDTSALCLSYKTPGHFARDCYSTQVD
jgi:predicted O-methyltransferase YrrM